MNIPTTFPSYRIKRHTHNIISGIIAISIAEKRYTFIKINVGVLKPSVPSFDWKLINLSLGWNGPRRKNVDRPVCRIV